MTGDRVKLYAQRESGSSYEIEPGPGRDKVRFTVREFDGHLSVFPDDALPLVGRGLVDKRLFDVTQLVAWDYDDAHSAQVPLIVRSSAAPRLAAKAAKGGWHSDALDLSTLEVTKNGAGQAWKELTAGASARSLAGGVSKIWLDGKREPLLHQSTKQIGAPAAWKRGLTGKGVKVAVLDSGYDYQHPGIADAVTDSANFSLDPNLWDMMGHGTALASIVAGSGKGVDGDKYRGVAPGAELAIGKVSSGSVEYRDSAILKGMEWAAGDAKAKVALLSIGTSLDSQEPDPLEEAVNTLTELYGTLFVVAAGNDGPGKATLNRPGTADAALTVGAVNKSDMVADFSGRGPRTGDHAVKPDITAPGVAITAGTVTGWGQDGPYIAQNGTSMAAAHAAGAAALLAEAHPDWTAEQLKGALIGTAAYHPEFGAYEQGGGRVDVDKATATPLTATPGNLWTTLPHGEDALTEKTVTYTNTSDKTLFLDLRVESAQPGLDLPSGLLKLSTQRVKVPAHGTASVKLAMNREKVEPGEYPGVLVASAGQDMLLRTLAGTYVEPESYDVTFKAIDRDGDPSDAAVALVYDLERNWLESVPLYQGTGSVRLPAGDWTVQGTIGSEAVKNYESILVHRSIRVDADHREVVMDGRQGEKVTVTLDDPDAIQQPVAVESISHVGAGREFRLTRHDRFGSDAGIFVIPVRVEGASYRFHNAWFKKAADGDVRYDLLKEHQGGLPDRPVYDFAVKDLAKITMVTRGAGVATGGGVVARPSGSYSFASPARFPGKVINYRTIIPGLTWDTTLSPGTGHSMTSLGQYVIDKSITEVWNRAIYGPGEAYRYDYGLVRTGNEFRFTGGRQYSDSERYRIGVDMSTQGEATLSSGGKVLEHVECVSPRGGLACGLEATLPEEPGVYTVKEVSTRNVLFSKLGTRVETSWTFPSSSTWTATPIPRLSARIVPVGLDELNQAKRTVSTSAGITIDCIMCNAPYWIKRLNLEVSYDDGATWQQVPVRGIRSDFSAVIKPAGKGDFASLRLTAIGYNDLHLTQTVIRAYGLKD
ncbi:S8 family serine peptidase [Spongiactinospora sp. 9N601]|uniref:S8 family serine peptidase n=1 Tax=Spongiactinospora sp. 9N601 TaxID=3375149 RepID=UPI0037980A4D